MQVHLLRGRFPSPPGHSGLFPNPNQRNRPLPTRTGRGLFRWFGLGKSSPRLWFLGMIHPYAMYDSSDYSYASLVGDLTYSASETMYSHAYLYITIHHPSRDLRNYSARKKKAASVKQLPPPLFWFYTRQHPLPSDLPFSHRLLIYIGNNIILQA